MSKSKTQIGIVGATGYTGVELLRLLAHHPEVEVRAVTSRQEAGKAVADYFPSLRGAYDLVFQAPADADLRQCDVVFFATPNGVAMKEAPALLAQGVKVIDLSADYRIQDLATWQKYYKMEHASPDWIKQAVYGLSEWQHEAIAQAQLIANPGCYPTCVGLPLLALLQSNALKSDTHIIADCKSGVSGAGRKAEIGSLFSEAGDNFKAYGVAGHRHLPEIRQTISAFSPEIAQRFTFVPHLTPLIRGMHATIYVELNEGVDALPVLQAAYQDSVFVDIMPQGSLPETRSVRGANTCRITAYRAPETKANQWIILSVIDNLVKGAAGQAVQNMNIMLGLPEQTALNGMPLLP